MIKLTHQDALSDNVHGAKDSLNNQEEVIDHAPIESCWKRLAREFLGYDILMDSLFFIHEDNFKLPLLRIPLSVLITYKGFKALAIANVALKG